MYTFESRIRYSEAESDGRLSLNALLDYFQDASIFHSEDIGLGVKYLADAHLAWVLSTWQIQIERYPLLGERVEIGTFPYEFRGFLGFRNFFMRTIDGEWLAKANTLWSLLDTSTGKPAVPPQVMKDRYGLEPKLDMDYAPRKITVPAGGTVGEPIVIRRHHLDTNHHVNNGKYVEMAQELLPEGFLGSGSVRQLLAEYKKQAFLGDVLYPYMVCEGDDFFVSLRTEDGQVYVNVKLTRDAEIL